MDGTATSRSLRRPMRATRWLSLLVVLALLAAACAGDDASPTTEAPAVDTTTDSGSDTTTAAPAEDLEVPTIGMSSSVQPSYILAMDGPLTYGSEFGLPVTADDFVSFDSHATVVQAALSGQVDIVGASTMAHLAIISEGQEFRIFAPMNHADDFVIAGRGEADEIADMTDPAFAVALDEPGGAGAAIVDAMLLAADAGFISSDLTEALIIGSSGGRTSALASGDADMTGIHLYQAESVDAETGDVNIIASLYDTVPVFMMQAYAAPADWLDENLDVAAAFTAGLIMSARSIHADFDAFKTAVVNYIPEPPDDATLQSIWDLASEYDFWPVQGGLEDERIQFMIDLGVTQGLLSDGMAVDDVVDRRPLEMALEMLGE